MGRQRISANDEELNLVGDEQLDKLLKVAVEIHPSIRGTQRAIPRPSRVAPAPVW